MAVEKLTDERINYILESTNKEGVKAFKDWLFDLQARGLNYYFCPNVYYVCWDISKKINTQDMDHVTVITGLEGVGKSTIASMLSVVVSPSMSINHVCYEPKDFFNALKIAKKGDTLWIDEGALFLFSRQSSTKNSVNVVKLLSVIRQLNLHIIICIPNFFTIDSYVREHRVSSLFYVTARGKFHYLPRKTILFVANACKRSKNILQYPLRPGTFWFGSYKNDFGDNGVFNKESYLKRKHDNMDDFMSSLEQSFQDMEDSEKMVSSPQFVSVAEAANFLGVSDHCIRDKIKSEELEATKLGSHMQSQWRVNIDSLHRFANMKKPA